MASSACAPRVRWADQYVILTSFNFLSFNPRPGKGLRREMGYRITDAAMVADVRARIGRALTG
jgi:hypothetical protein